jgi:uncharacterized protein with HEPN domain
LRDFQVYVEDIIEAIDSIQAYTKGLTYEKFSCDKKTIDAVIRNFEIIGEATKQMPLAVRQEYSKVPWREMAGMRDKLIHGYFGVQLDVVWKTVKERIPAVRISICEVLAELKREKSQS